MMSAAALLIGKTLYIWLLNVIVVSAVGATIYTTMMLLRKCYRKPSDTDRTE